MISFSGGVINAESFLGIQVSWDPSDDLAFDVDLKATVEKLFLYQVQLHLGDYPELKGIWLGEEPVQDKSFSNLKSLVVEGCEFLSDVVLPSHLLPFLSNLEELKVRKCNSVTAIFDARNTAIHDEKKIDTGSPSSIDPPLKKLILELLPNLKRVWKEDPQGCLTLPFLEEVLVDGCESIESLFPASVAIDTVRLQKLDVSNCETLVEIVAKDEASTQEAIKGLVFPNLTSLILWNLPNLWCIYHGMSDLYKKRQKSKEWLELKELYVFRCKKLQKFLDSTYSHTKSQACFPNDKKAAFQKRHLGLGDYPELQQIWLRVVPVPIKSFCNLKSLVVEGCEFLTNAVLPSHLLPVLSKLEKLEVRNCDSIEAIFDVKDTPRHSTRMITMGSTSSLSLPLEKLILEQLPKLKHVWNEDPRGSLSLPFLEEVLVDGCTRIESLFPASVANDRLQKLDVKNCKYLQEIVAKDEAAKGSIDFVLFPSLTLLRLWRLPNLKCIYTGKHSLKWPMLKELDVSRCQMLKIFATDFQNSPEGQDRFPAYQHGSISVEKVADFQNSPDQQGFISVEEILPNLEQVTLSKKDTMMVERRQRHADLQKIKFLKLQRFHDGSDIESFLSKVALPRIEKLGLDYCTFKDMDFMKNLKILSQLKFLALIDLPVLQSIGLEHSWMDHFLGNLETLDIHQCRSLENLAPSTVSFSHLTALIVGNCEGLENLFTSSTAKNLGALNKLDISDCESLAHIVAAEGDEPENDEIQFEHLKILSLNKLPSLRRFCLSRSTLKFPSLEKVSIAECRLMKFFGWVNNVLPPNLEVEKDGCQYLGLDAAILFRRGLYV